MVTGGAMPEWADTVIPVEMATVGEGDFVAFAQVPELGANIRVKGGDLDAGSPLMHAGTMLDPDRIMVAAAIYSGLFLLFAISRDERNWYFNKVKEIFKRGSARTGSTELSMPS